MKKIKYNINKRINGKSKLLLFIPVIVAIVFFSSCKKFVETPPPTTSLVSANVFDKNSTATAAQLAIYAQIQSYPFNINWVTGLSSDELKYYSTSSSGFYNVYSNSLSAVNDADKISIWKPSYNFIYQVNAILEAILNSPGVSAPVKNQLTGESKFLRGFFYFYLTNLYGDIPLALTTDYKINSQLSSTPKAQVFQQVITDLTDAQDLLNSGFVDASDTTVYPIANAERVRPTKWAATALLARVYLCQAGLGDNSAWAKAEAASTDLINNKTMFDTVSLNNVFLKNSKEAIWQIMPNSSNKYTPEGSVFILTVNPVSNQGTYVSSLSDQLFNSFELGDARKTQWVGKYTSGTNTWYFPNKYKDGLSATSLKEYSMVLRLTEQYLIRAEARAEQNNLSGAIADLNVIRHRASLPDYSGAVNQASILAAIKHERQVELFAEGQRWLDLKRTSTVDAMMNAVTPQKGGAWQSYQQLYPIPTTDIQNDVYLTQNTGY